MKEYTEKDLVDFGNYLLSTERDKRTTRISRHSVTHADIENWKSHITVIVPNNLETK